MGIARQSPPTPELKVFSDRLRKAIDFKKIDIAVLAKDSEYKPDVIHKLLAGTREPGMKKLIFLANALGCSVDYLLGLSPEPQREGVVIKADTNAIKGLSGEHGETPELISGRIKQFAAILPELLECDAELLMRIAGFLIERNKKRLARFADALAAKSPKEANSLLERSCPENNDEFNDDIFEEEDDDLWDSIEDDTLGDDGLGDDCFDEEDDFDDCDDFEDDEYFNDD
jgi:transcriptional regulator with XRE-family HTH domain